MAYFVETVGIKYLGLYLQLLSHRNKSTNECFLYLGKLAEDLNIPKRRLKRQIECLETAGIIIIEDSINGGNYFFFPLEPDFIPLETYTIKTDIQPKIEVINFLNQLPHSEKQHVKAYISILNKFKEIGDIELAGIYYYLIKHRNIKKEACFPSYSTLAEETNLSIVSVNKKMLELEQKEDLLKIKRHGSNFGGNYYYFPLQEEVEREERKLKQERKLKEEKIKTNKENKENETNNSSTGKVVPLWKSN
jgi:predicted transcriptional regulator